MEDFRRRQYLPGSPQPKWLHNSLSSKDDRAIGGEGFRGQLSDPKAQSLLMELFSKADSFGCDKQGRINLNDKLLEHAGIEGKAVLVGKLTSFAIWAEDRREAEEAQDDERDIFDAMRELGL